MTDEILTPREMEVLHLLAQGLRNQEIADALSISLNTLETHMRHIHEKLKLKSRTEVLLWYKDNKGKGSEK